MARPERFELPTAWFVVLYPKLSNHIIYLTKRELFCPILLPYVALYALFWGCLVPFIGQLAPPFLQEDSQPLQDNAVSFLCLLQVIRLQ